MNATINARTVLDFALLQSAAECYLDGFNPNTGKETIHRKLKEGANNAQLQGKVPNDPILAGATRFTDAQAEWFTTNYEIVTHYPNDSSGFSATLFRRTQDDPITGAKAGEYTLSFRSTEYQFQDKGGDYERDGADATDGDISGKGYALAQLSARPKGSVSTCFLSWVGNPCPAALRDIRLALAQGQAGKHPIQRSAVRGGTHGEARKIFEANRCETGFGRVRRAFGLC